jgi:decaprenyl-phosphate phosphoribosyltransferase
MVVAAKLLLKPADYIDLLRPKQWVKNLFVLSPLFFAGQFTEGQKLLPPVCGMVAFSLVASGMYVLNDYRDMVVDRLHPEKCKRPLASGAIPISQAFVLMACCLVVGLALAFVVQTTFASLLSLYVGLNLGYSFGLKHVPILDVFIIASGFVLRIICGGMLAAVPVSQWLVVMIFLLSLFLGLAKRRDDLLIRDASQTAVRKVIKYYNHDFLNACIIMVSGIIIVAYLMYTLSPPVMERLGSSHLYYTSMFVIAGIMRYLQLIYVANDAGSPTEVVYKDRVIQLTILLWILSFFVIIYHPYHLLD